MKINTLLEYTSPSSQPNQAGGQAPKFGRDPNVLETTTGSTATGSIGADATAMPGMQRRSSKGSMFQGISTSKKFVNSPVTEDEISEEQLLSKELRKELFKRAKDRDLGNRPEDREIMSNDPEYDDEAGMVASNLHTALRAVQGLHKVIGPNENLPEWVQEKIAIANDYLVTCWDYMISQHEQGRKYEVDENQDWMKDIAAMAHKMAPQDKMRKRQAERDAQAQADRQQRIQQDIENLPDLIAQYRDMKSKYESMGGSNWQYADREQNLSDKERKARGMETSMRHLANRIHAAKKASEGLAEVAPPGAKAERMVKHIKKSYSKDGKLTPKEKSIAYATTWKAHNKGKVEEQGVAEGPKEVLGLTKFAMGGGILGGQSPAAIVDEQGVAEGLPQTLRKVVPGYAKREIDNKMDAGKFGKTDVDKDANFQRYKKIQDKIKKQGVAEGMYGDEEVSWEKGGRRAPTGAFRNPAANNVVFSGTGDNGGKYEIIQSGDDFMIHANGKHIDSYGSLQRAMSVLKNEVPGLKKTVDEESKGLWANIHAKRERIKQGSGEHMRKPGSKGAPTASALRKSAK